MPPGVPVAGVPPMRKLALRLGLPGGDPCAGPGLSAASRPSVPMRTSSRRWERCGGQEGGESGHAWWQERSIGGHACCVVVHDAGSGRGVQVPCMPSLTRVSPGRSSRA